MSMTQEGPTSFTTSVFETPAVTALASNGANGVEANTDFGVGVSGESTSGVGVGGFSTNIGVRGICNISAAESSSSSGVSGESSVGTGVSGESTNGFGVRGTSENSSGVRGESSFRAGVSGESGSGTGVLGESTFSVGVRGTSLNSFGVRGESHGETGHPDTDVGVSGWSKTGTGVEGISEGNGIGVWGESTSGDGVRGIDKTDGVGVRGWSNSGVGVSGSSSSGLAGQFSGNVQVDGNFTVTGTHTKAFVQAHPSDPDKEIVYVTLEGGEAGTYVRGSGQLQSGKAVLALPEHFGLVTSNTGLTVQLTPRGAWLQLYVVELDTAQIVVREAQGKSGAFDYLIQGVRRGFEQHEVIRSKS